MLPRAVHLLVAVLLLAGRPVAGQLADVGEGGSTPSSAREQVRRRRSARRGRRRSRRRAGHVRGGADVVADDQRAQRRQGARARRPAARRRRLAGGSAAKSTAALVAGRLRRRPARCAAARAPASTWALTPTRTRAPGRRTAPSPASPSSCSRDHDVAGLDLVPGRDADARPPPRARGERTTPPSSRLTRWRRRRPRPGTTPGRATATTECRAPPRVSRLS